MTRFQWLAFLFASLLCRPVLAQSSGDAVSVDPTVHRVILENEHLRIFDARAALGTKSPMHTHPPMVLISLGKSRFRMSLPDGQTTLFDLNPGEVHWIVGAHHGWDLLVGELHAIGVEIKSAQGAGDAPSAADRSKIDSVAVDPEAHHLLFDNPHVRVFEGRTSHGRSSPMHAHPPTLLVSLDWARLRLKLPDGSSAIHDFSPGQVLWLADGGTHSWEAVAGNTRVIAIEVKSAKAAVEQ